MSPPEPSPAKFSETLRVGLRCCACAAVSGRLKTSTVSAPSHQNHTGLGSGAAARRDGRQPDDAVLAQVARDQRAEVRALVDHGADLCARRSSSARTSASSVPWSNGFSRNALPGGRPPRGGLGRVAGDEQRAQRRQALGELEPGHAGHDDVGHERVDRVAARARRSRARPRAWPAARTV